MNFYDMLDELENQSGSNDKEDYLVYILKHVRNAEAYFRFAFNDQVFGVKETTFINTFYEDYVPEMNEWEHISDWFGNYRFPGDRTATSSKICTVQDLIKFGLDLLNSSGEALQVDIRAFFSELTPQKRKWFCRAILKDLRCGVKVKTMNRAFKRAGLKPIEKFALQLCGKVDVYDEKDFNKKIKLPASMECKYDGIRLQAEVWVIKKTVNPGPVVDFVDYEMGCRLTSRRGNDRTDAHPDIVEALKKVFVGENLTLDGEVISRSFQELTKKDSGAAHHYVIFDLLMDEKLPYINRWDNLISLCAEKGIAAYKDKQITLNKDKHIFTAEHYSCNSIKDVQEYYEDLNSRGEEGIILKNDRAPYERGSRKHMFKCKKVYTADLLCVGYKLGEGRRTNKVSTLCLEDASGEIEVDVGSGIDDDMCELLTNYVEEVETVPEFIGWIVEIKYNEITETGSLRFPRFICFREDKDEADDLSTAEVRQA